MQLKRPLWRAAAAVATTAALMTGCTVGGLAFRDDKRVRFLSPPNHSTQTLPVRVSWTTHDFEVTGPDGRASPDAGYFAVFLDRPPQPPGETIAFLARDDHTCRASLGCPNETWFSEHHIYPTTATSFVVDSLPTRTKEEQRRFHEITVVLLDGQGRRIGENAYWVEFRVTGSRAS